MNRFISLIVLYYQWVWGGFGEQWVKKKSVTWIVFIYGMVNAQGYY